MTTSADAAPARSAAHSGGGDARIAHGTTAAPRPVTSGVESLDPGADPLSHAAPSVRNKAGAPTALATTGPMSAPVHPPARKTSLLLPNESNGKSPLKTLHMSRSMSSLVTPTRSTDPRRRRPLVSYVTSPPGKDAAASPQLGTQAAPMSKPGPAAQPDSIGSTAGPAGTVDVDALLEACANYSRSNDPKRSGSLHADMLHAIAAKERLCLELREQLHNEEAHLKALQTAWQRLATRGGVKVVSSSMASPRHPELLRRRQSNILSPSSIQARRTEQASSAVPVRPPSEARPSPSPSKTSESSWRMRLPHQLSSWVEHVTPAHEPSTAPAPQRTPAHDVAQWLTSREMENGRTPATPRVAADVLNQPQAIGSATLAERRMSSVLPDQAPELPPKESDGLGDKLLSSWNVLSKRLIETTSTLTDPHTWNEGLAGPPSSRGSLPRDYMSDAPDSNASDSLRPLSSLPTPMGAGASLLGMRSIMSQKRYADDEPTSRSSDAPPVPWAAQEPGSRRSSRPLSYAADRHPDMIGADEGGGDAGYAANLIDLEDMHAGGVRHIDDVGDVSIDDT
ncbi:hypothetical protein MBRA1_001972 [Malassezia brasiliensis]|uniref:Uncharacterized protein n=1 Tax=Malassezia brasiliensis TaxID=1821822 RepID=A0AAF0IPU2_9BASI|nr:hypothetical protein MBRA1_001972 [Malassezia brasiliensis]